MGAEVRTSVDSGFSHILMDPYISIGGCKSAVSKPHVKYVSFPFLLQQKYYFFKIFENTICGFPKKLSEMFLKNLLKMCSL